MKSIRLPSSVTIADVKACADQLRGAFAESSSVKLDCVDFESGDVTLVQLLVCARKSAALAGGSLALEHVNDEMLTLLKRAGCELADVTLPPRFN